MPETSIGTLEVGKEQWEVLPPSSVATRPGVTDGAVSQQCFLDQMLVQVPLGHPGFFTSSGREGRTGDQKTSRSFYRCNDFGSSYQQLMAEAPEATA